MVSGDGQAVPPAVEGVDQIEEDLGLEVRRLQLIDVVPEQACPAGPRVTDDGLGSGFGTFGGACDLFDWGLGLSQERTGVRKSADSLLPLCHHSTPYQAIPRSTTASIKGGLCAAP